MRTGSILRAAGKLLIAASFFILIQSCVHQWPAPAETQIILNLEFDTELPPGPVHDLSTKASDGQEQEYDMRYIIHAFRRTGSRTYEDTPYAKYIFTQDDINNPDKTVTLDIMEGDYRFMVWSDYVLQGTDEDLYYNADSFRYIKLYGSEEKKPHVGNTDYRDAFMGTSDVEVIRFGGNHKPVTSTIAMSRPLSKVVIITNDLDDWKTKVKTSLYEMSLQGSAAEEKVEVPTTVDLSDYVIKIHYPMYMPNAFNVANDHTAWSDVNVSFKSQMVQLSENEAALGFDYVFANAGEAYVVMAISLFDKKGTQLARSSDITVPLERGKVTTVIGSFLLEESDGGVSINPDFEGEFNIVI